MIKIHFFIGGTLTLLLYFFKKYFIQTIDDKEREEKKFQITTRKKKRYIQRRTYWENQYKRGLIPALKLQSAYAAVHQIINHADSNQWLKRQKCRFVEMDI